MANNDGGSAFPCTRRELVTGTMSTYKDNPYPGMSLRDYFASKAMAALIIDGKFYDDSNVGIEDIVVNAYMFADAMLVERAAKGDK